MVRAHVLCPSRLNQVTPSRLIDPARPLLTDGHGTELADRNCGHRPRRRIRVHHRVGGRKGVTATLVLDGPMTAARFRECFSTVLMPTLRPGDTVVLDSLP